MENIEGFTPDLNAAKRIADKIIGITHPNDIPLESIGRIIALHHLNAFGYYGYKKSETNENILLVKVH